MKLKLLIAPLLVVIIIVLAIWVIAPSYRQLQSQKEEAALLQKKLTDIQEKNRQASKLKQDLDGGTVNKEVVFKFIPKQQQEELLVENLNALATGEGLSVNGLGVTTDSGSATVAAPNNNNLGAEAAAPTARMTAVTLGVAGPYEKIKSLTNKLVTLQRYNSITALKISSAPNTSGTGPKTLAAGSLQADFMVNFAYLPDNNSIVNADNSIFSSGKFDTTVIDQITKQLSTNFVGLSVEGAGKPNPFQP